MARRPRPKLVSLTDAAAARVAEIMSEKGAGYLRVGVTNGGCAGMEYVMDYVEAPAQFDEIVEDKGVKIVVDAKAVLFLLGSTVDYETTLLHERFTFGSCISICHFPSTFKRTLSPRTPALNKRRGTSRL